jgi:2-aminoadipate transaminase
MKSSIIRELLDTSRKPDIISFAGGLPDPEAFPAEIVNDIVKDLIKSSPDKIMQYGNTEGVPDLKEQISMRMKDKWSIDGGPEKILITVGSQQGLDILGRLFVDKESSVVIEAPTYLGALNTFKPREPCFISMPMDEDGLMIDVLDDYLNHIKDEMKPLKFLYTIPTFQNPSGTCMSLSRRRRLIDLSHQHDFLIIEDDPYSELRYHGENRPKLAALDKEDKVIYLGTLSKTLAPGFRIAWTHGPVEIIEKMSIAKQAVDLCSPTFTQHVALEYIRRGYLDRHLQEIKRIYSRKQRTMVLAMDDLMPRDYINWNIPEGGMFLWCEMNENMDSESMFVKAMEEKVAYVFGKAFFIDGSGNNFMRLNFTHANEEMIVEGIRRLSNVVERYGDEQTKRNPSMKYRGTMFLGWPMTL